MSVKVVLFPFKGIFDGLSEPAPAGPSPLHRLPCATVSQYFGQRHVCPLTTPAGTGCGTGGKLLVARGDCGPHCAPRVCFNGEREQEPEAVSQGAGWKVGVVL